MHTTFTSNCRKNLKYCLSIENVGECEQRNQILNFRFKMHKNIIIWNKVTQGHENLIDTKIQK